MQIEMTIKGLMVDPITNMPIIILRDKAEQRVLPIWVGMFEANAIALQIENVTTPRPMTHDLLRNVIHDLKADIQKIVVSDLKDNTFYALIYLMVNGEAMAIDVSEHVRQGCPVERADIPGEQRPTGGRSPGTGFYPMEHGRDFVRQTALRGSS